MGLKKLFIEIGSISGYLIGIIGGIISFLSVSGSVTISSKWLILIGFILLVLIVTSIKAVVDYDHISKNGIRYAVVAYENYDDKNYYYTNYSDNLRVGTIVCIYYNRPRSRKMGYGIVRNTCAYDYVEIEVLHISSDMDSYYQQSKSNNKVLSDIYILPNVYEELIPEIVSILDMEG